MSMIKFIFLFLILCKYENVYAATRIKRVVGGFAVPDGQFPIAVSLKNLTSGAHVCGGILINKNTVLTAAHCIEYGSPNDYSIRLENIHLNNDNEINKQLIQSNISKIFKHELYERMESSHDIAILHLTKNFHELENYMKQLLPQTSFGLTGQCEVYGYGATEMNSEITFNKLRMAIVKIISHQECVDMLGQYMAPKENGGLVCAIGASSDACQGDSGSPLICNRKLEGIVSYGVACGINSLPGVYTRVSIHMDWISKIIQSNLNE